MPFVKVQKTKQYFKRYQVKYRRRREGKTDYRARKRLVAQDKNKYMSPRYRLVVRLTNRYVIAQIVYATIDGDCTLAAANSAELPRYGLKIGLKNYAAAYATGLLVARRLLQKLGLDETYTGVEEPTGEIVTSKDESSGRTFYVPELDEDKRPFRAILDIGIRNTTTGARIFGALKGASDGGLDIPQSEKRFPGYDREGKKYDAEAHKERILGQHVSEYMAYLQEEDPQMYEKQFATYVAEGITSEDLEELYTKVHEEIRADPSPAAKNTHDFDPKYKRKGRDTLEQRKARVAEKKAAIKAAKGEEDEPVDMEEDAQETRDEED